jgi:methylenetetrahydrofolate dehydrogenase (NADP+)/methenyltetrahydrofolate cyclohydrolase
MFVIDGRHHAANIYEKLRSRLTTASFTPGLAVIRVGDNPASVIYIKAKKKACLDVGFTFEEYVLPPVASYEEVSVLINRLNEARHIHGILLQLPLPEHLDPSVLINQIAPEKDVDGLTDINMGRLWNGQPLFIPCTPRGCLSLLRSVSPHLQGSHAVILGRSRIVGRPLQSVLALENCTTTLIHSHTVNPKSLCQQADIVIAAVGQPHLVNDAWIKPGAIVIDVGINRYTREDGSLGITGDVDFEKVAPLASAITPVPGGVGPMTIASLLENVFEAAQRLTDRL